ncbi:MAG: ATP-binding protein [Ignavibacteriaceae bacterium]|jgi:nitrogen fixation/metabolism regulation signal transduction histidine kinase
MVLLLAALFQVYALIRFINHTNREVTDFIRGINYSDFTQNVRLGKLGGTFVELSEEMTKLLNKYKDTRFEKEENLRYLQTIVEHVGIGLIAFNTDGHVELINKAAKKILKITHLQNIYKLDEKQNGFGQFLFQMPSDKRSTFKLFDNGETIQLMVHSTEFRMKEQNLKLISLYNIQPELEEKEIEAWQKLIRVLTHEIMNSITPISSLAATAAGLITNSDRETICKEALADIENALTTIHRRSDGLTSFVNKFRDISKIPKPNFQTVSVADLFYRVRLLTGELISSSDIHFSVCIHPENMEIVVDPDLLEQVLINLINNSVHAIKEPGKGEIKLTAEINERGRAIVKVIDNGCGITEDVLDKVFIPFFSTKQEGSGIGLSISQSIIRAHGGNIWVQSQPNKETVFSIRL